MNVSPGMPLALAAATALNLLIVQPAAAIPQQSAPPITDPALRAFVEQVAREWPGESHQQALTVASLTLLADAIKSVAERRRLSSPRVAQGVDELRSQTRAYGAAAPSDGGQGVRLRQAFVTASDLVAHLVNAAGIEKEPVDPRLSALRRSAESLDTTQSLRRQPDVIERFFHHAAEALQRVARH